MEILFLELCWVSLLCSVGILVIFGVSHLLRKTHTVFWRYCLWTLLAARLVLPFDFSVSGRAVVIPLADWTLAEDILTVRKSAVETERDGAGIDSNGGNKTEIDKALADGRKEDRNQSGAMDEKDGNREIREYEAGIDETGKEEGKAKKQQILSQERMDLAGVWVLIFRWASVVWAAGAAALLGWQAVCYVIFSRKVKKEGMLLTEKGGLLVYVSGAVTAPMLMGICRPRIVLPDRAYEKEQLAFILDHEYAHYRRKDLWARLLLALARTLHWFNPLVARMERQAIRDMELLCDSHVVRYFSREEKKRYGQTLLDCAADGKNRIYILGASEFSRDAETIKERFANIFSGEGKKRGIMAVALGVFLLVSASLFVVFDASKKGVGGESYEPQNANLQETDAREIPRLLELTEEEAANAVYGVVSPRLVYASDERAVLYDYWGLLIYDMKNRRIEQLLDLKAADLNHMQGDMVTHVEVSADGGQILLYNEPDAQERFVYYIDDKRLKASDLDAFTGNHYDGLYERGERNYALTETGKAVHLSVDSLRAGDGEIYHSEDMQGLSLVSTGPDWGKSEIYPLFSDYYEKLGDEVFCCLKTEDFDRVVGKRLLYGDEDGWSYYLEEDEEKESALWEAAGAMEPLLLTRYRDGRRQILEDLIYHEAFLECPVLFAGGRIVYKAAQTADIGGVKEAALVSIAMDGSDRKVADTILYRVFDGICEDDGWIYYSGWTNDNLLPKPLCRISPDFSSGAQLVEEISGYLCGVMDGYVYYLAGGDRGCGIWKRSLATGEEQIYSKWGVAAEGMRLFWVREQQVPAGELRDMESPGCRILYTLGYDREIYAVSEAFDAGN